MRDRSTPHNVSTDDPKHKRRRGIDCCCFLLEFEGADADGGAGTSRFRVSASSQPGIMQ